MKRLVFKMAAVILILVILMFNFIPVAVEADTPILNIQGTTIFADIPAGGSYVHTVTFSSGSPLDIELEASGLGQTTDGSTVNLSVIQDNGPYTARPFISNIDKTSLHLETGVPQSIKITFNLPAGTTPGERYAGIYIHQIADPNVTIIVAAIIPVIINTAGYSSNRTGIITDLSVPQAYKGLPVKLNTTFNNSGNCRIANSRNNITIRDKSSGIVKWNNETSLADPSLLPGFPRIVTSKYNTGLNTGIYTATSQIKLEDGAVLDTKTLDFQVIEPPAVPSAPILASPGSSTSPGPVIDTLTPTFLWNSVSGADYYILTISRDPYGSSNTAYISNHLNGTAFTLPSGYLFGGQKYSWQMTATNVSGTSAGSSVFYFQSTGASTLPEVTTGSASNVTSNRATLNGALTGLGSAGNINVSFEYGQSNSYGSTTAEQALITTGAFNANITGLTGNTTYHFRAKAVGSSTVYGYDSTFTTSQTGTLTVTTSAASSITSTGATLNGTLTGLGSEGSAIVSFEYGTSTNYGNSTDERILATTRTFYANITGLKPNNTYYFRAKAVEASTVYGSVMTFTTASATPTPTPMPTLTLIPTPTFTPSATPVISRPPPATINPPALTQPVSRSYKDYFPAVIDESSLVYQDYSGQQPLYFNAIDKTGTEVELTGTMVRGVITIVAGMYHDEPQTGLEFSSGLIKGGAGKPWIKFIGLRVEGQTQGTAHMTLLFTEAEVSDYDPDSLFLSYFSGGSWHKCSNIVISTENQTISGDIPVSRLSGTAIGLGGALLKEAPAGAIAENGNGQQTGKGIPWTLAGIIIATIIIVGGVILVLGKNRRMSSANR